MVRLSGLPRRSSIIWISWNISCSFKWLDLEHSIVCCEQLKGLSLVWDISCSFKWLDLEHSLVYREQLFERALFGPLPLCLHAHRPNNGRESSRHSVTPLIPIILLLGFISISPKTRNLIGTSFNYLSKFVLSTVNNKNKDKWIDKPAWFNKPQEFKPAPYWWNAY